MLYYYIYGYFSQNFENKEAMKMTFAPKNHAPSTPVPIPRTGISGAPNIFLHLLLGLTSAFVPVGIASALGASRLPSVAAELLSAALLALLAAYFIRTGKLAGKSSRGLLPILGFVAVFLIYMTQSAITAAVSISVIFFVGEGAVLLATQTKKNAVWLPLIPLAALALSLILCKSADVALLCLLPLPAALALAFGTRSSAAKDTGLTRVGVICLTSLCLGIAALGFIAWFLYQAMGTLELSAIQDLVNNLHTELIQSIMDVHFETKEGITYPFEGQETLVSNAVTLTMNLLPAIGVVLCNVAAAISQMVALSGLTAYGFGASITDHVRVYRISAVSSFVFLVASVVSLVANAETTTLVGTVAENFTVILLPGLALAGFIRLVVTLARKGCAPGCLIFILIFFLSGVAIAVLAGYEAISSVFGPLIARLKPPKHDDDDLFPPRQGNNDDINDRDLDNDRNNDDSDPPSDDGPSLF